MCCRRSGPLHGVLGPQGTALVIGVTSASHMEVVWATMEHLGRTRFLRSGFVSSDGQVERAGRVGQPAAWSLSLACPARASACSVETRGDPCLGHLPEGLGCGLGHSLSLLWPCKRERHPQGRGPGRQASIRADGQGPQGLPCARGRGLIPCYAPVSSTLLERADEWQPERGVLAGVLAGEEAGPAGGSGRRRALPEEGLTRACALADLAQ